MTRAIRSCVGYWCLITFLIFLTALDLKAQTVNPITGIDWPLIMGSGAPTSSCTSSNYGQPYQDNSITPNGHWACGTAGWEQVGLPYAGGTLTGPLNGTVGTFSSLVTGKQVGAVFQADQFTGADVSAQINNCILAVVAAGGGICDASGFNGTYTMLNEIDLGSHSQGAANIFVTLVVPANGLWQWSLTGGTACGIKQFDQTSITRLGAGGGGGGNRLRLEALAAANMDSVYCTDPSPPNGGSYIRAEGFYAFAASGATLTTGVFNIQKLFDESSYSYIAGGNATGDVWVVNTVCCGTSFDHIQGFGSQVSTPNSAGYPLKIIQAQATVISNSTFNGAGSGKNNVYIGGGTYSAGITFLNDYEERYLNDGTPMNLIAHGGPGGDAQEVLFIGGQFSGPTSSACFENDSNHGFTIQDASCSGTMTTLINDVSNGRVWNPPGGMIPYYSTVYKPGAMPTYTWGQHFLDQFATNSLYVTSANSTSAPYIVGASNFTPTAVGWYRLLGPSPIGLQSASGTVTLSGAYHNHVTTAVVDYTIQQFGQAGQLTARNVGGYAGVGPIDEIEVSSDGAANTYLDVHVSDVTSAGPITAVFQGQGTSQFFIISNPVVGATPGSSSVAIVNLNNLATGTSFVTTGGANVGFLTTSGVRLSNSTNDTAIGQDGSGNLVINPIYHNITIQAGTTGSPRTSTTLGSNGAGGWAVDGSGNFTTTTQAAGDNSAKVATTAYAQLLNLVASLTTTSATSDNVTISGMTSSGHCSLTATNASAATNVASTYVSAKTTNQITVTHTGTASMTYDVRCTPY